MSSPTAAPIVARETKETDATTPVALHPLLIVNITDHHTRCALMGGKQARAVGILLGQQTGRKIEVFTSYELLYTVKGDTIDIDEAFLKARRDSFQQVFPDYDVVGWYTTGTGLSVGDIATHFSVLAPLNESALALVLDATPPPNERTLPAFVFEPRGANTLARVGFTVESEESERIGVETAMRVDEAEEGQTSLVPQATRLCSAVQSLGERVTLVVAYLDAVTAGTVEPDFELLRKIRHALNQLPRGDAPRLAEAKADSARDALLIAFLGVLAKGSAQLMQLGSDTVIVRQARSARQSDSILAMGGGASFI